MSKRIRSYQIGPSLWEMQASRPVTPAPDYRCCVLVGHMWHTVSLDGRQQCQVCRLIAYCPRCTSTFPPSALFAFCMRHQEVTP